MAEAILATFGDIEIVRCRILSVSINIYYTLSTLCIFASDITFVCKRNILVSKCLVQIGCDCLIRTSLCKCPPNEALSWVEVCLHTCHHCFFSVVRESLVLF